MIDAAIDLARRGFRVHPLKAKDQPYTAYSRTATTIEADVAAMWRRWPDALIGIATGDGLVVVDIDPQNGGVIDHELEALTLTATTPKGGRHHYFRCDLPIRNSVGKVAEGVDLRGQGGYVVAPPSEDRAWLTEPVFMSYLPPVIVEACRREEQRVNRAFEPRTHVAAGERHDYLVRFVGWAAACELATNYADLCDVAIDHAMQVCEPWPGIELPGVHKHIAGIVRWVLAREAGAR